MLEYWIKKETTPVEWQSVAKQCVIAEFGDQNVWDSLEFAARCESFMPSHIRKDPMIWLQSIHPSYPHVRD